MQTKADYTPTMSLTTPSQHLHGDVPSKVWTFVLGPLSRPRQMLVHPEDGGYVGIKLDGSVFPLNCQVYRVPATVDGRLYLIYFDRVRYTSDRTNATYVFLHLLHKTTVVDFSVEEDLPDIMCIMTV